MASVDLSNSSFLHLLLLCSPISTLPSLTAMTPYLPRSSFLAWLEVSQYSGFSSHRPPYSPPSPLAPSHPFIWSYKHFLCLVPPTFWDFSIRFPSLPQSPPIHPRLSLGPPTNLFNPFSYLPKKLFFKLHSSTPLKPSTLLPKITL